MMTSPTGRKLGVSAAALWKRGRRIRDTMKNRFKEAAIAAFLHAAAVRFDERGCRRGFAIHEPSRGQAGRFFRREQAKAD
ncbi:hypothetical protein J6TS7_54410 [Paenibacillus dendritiformis]|nr:hypothetical protein J6TS7_54410 [Paenibacillus dendritiformis]